MKSTSLKSGELLLTRGECAFLVDDSWRSGLRKEWALQCTWNNPAGLLHSHIFEGEILLRDTFGNTLVSIREPENCEVCKGSQSLIAEL